MNEGNKTKASNDSIEENLSDLNADKTPDPINTVDKEASTNANDASTSSKIHSNSGEAEKRTKRRKILTETKQNNKTDTEKANR